VVFWDMVPCSLVVGYQYFEGKYCLDLAFHFHIKDGRNSTLLTAYKATFYHNSRENNVNHGADKCSGNIPDSYSGGVGFESRLGHHLSSVPSGTFRNDTRFSYDCLLSNPFQFINHRTILSYIVERLIAS
jgi:hypothetical protein